MKGARAPHHLFVLWAAAREQEQRVLDDLRRVFTVADLAEITWTADETFAWSLTRMYGDSLPPGSEKEKHGGTGPFLAVLVADQKPRYRPRRTGRGWRLQNTHVFDARLRYRGWTGGGYRVHASDSVAETERNLVLLYGAGLRELVRSRHEPRAVGDPVGTHGWESVSQLVRVLTPYGLRRWTLADQRLHLVVADAWWAEHLLGGEALDPHARLVQIAGRQVVVDVVQPCTAAERMRASVRHRPAAGAPS